jgi:hypothetical protein
VVTPPEGGLEWPGFTLCEALRSISAERLVRRLGAVIPATMEGGRGSPPHPPRPVTYPIGDRAREVRVTPTGRQPPSRHTTALRMAQP